MAEWRLAEVVDGWGAVEPIEGSGWVSPYFTAHKLCDAQTALTPETWDPLRRNPAWSKDSIAAPSTSPGSGPDPDWQKKLTAWGDKVIEGGRRGSDLAAVSATIAALPPEEIPDYLPGQIQEFFQAFPDGSLWFMEVDSLLARRLGLFRVLLALETIPDFLDATDRKLPQIQTLQEHSLTSGTAFDSLIDPVLLAIPPSALGYSFSWIPHGLVFLFGGPQMLIEPHPPTFASLYAPRMHGAGTGFHWRKSGFWEDVSTSDIEALFQWWVSRLNVIYSYAADPTNFADETGRFSAARQTVWFMTFERLMADALSIGSSPQASARARLETGFDLLDKAEALLGYTKRESGKGFQRLLRRDEMIPRLEAIWDTRLPIQLRSRFKAHTRHLYDRIYEDIKENAYDFRVTGQGINVWSSEKGRLIEWSWDSFVPRIVRAVRNSAHGLMEVFDSRDRDLVVAHSGQMPPELPELAAFLVLALVADGERLCARTWLV